MEKSNWTKSQEWHDIFSSPSLRVRIPLLCIVWQPNYVFQNEPTWYIGSVHRRCFFPFFYELSIFRISLSNPKMNTNPFLVHTGIEKHARSLTELLLQLCVRLFSNICQLRQSNLSQVQLIYFFNVYNSAGKWQLATRPFRSTDWLADMQNIISLVLSPGLEANAPGFKRIFLIMSKWYRDESNRSKGEMYRNWLSNRLTVLCDSDIQVKSTHTIAIAFSSSSSRYAYFSISATASYITKMPWWHWGQRPIL